MKKLVFLVVLAGFMYGVIFVLQSVHFCLFELQRAVDQGDLQEVEKRADLDAFARNIVDFQEAQVRVWARQTAGQIGEGLVDGLAKYFRKPVQYELVPDIKKSLESEIAGGRLLQDMEPFRLSPGLLAFGGIDERGDDRIFYAQGTCHGEPASVSVIFSPVRNERWGGFLRTYRAMGIERESIRTLVGACDRGEKKKTP